MLLPNYYKTVSVVLALIVSESILVISPLSLFAQQQKQLLQGSASIITGPSNESRKINSSNSALDFIKYFRLKNQLQINSSQQRTILQTGTQKKQIQERIEWVPVYAKEMIVRTEPLGPLGPAGPLGPMGPGGPFPPASLNNVYYNEYNNFYARAVPITSNESLTTVSTKKLVGWLRFKPDGNFTYVPDPRITNYGIPNIDKAISEYYQMHPDKRPTNGSFSQ